MPFGLISYCHPSSWTYEIYIYKFIFYYSPCPMLNNIVKKKCVLGYVRSYRNSIYYIKVDGSHEFFLFSNHKTHVIIIT